MDSQVSIEIDRPIEQVFNAANECITEWSVTCVSDEIIEDKGGVGTTFRMVTQERGKEMEFTGEVTRWDPPLHSAVYLVGTHFDIDTEFRFEDLGGRTRVSQRAVVHGRGFTKVVFALLGWVFNRSSCKALDNELECLKNFCEARPEV